MKDVQTGLEIPDAPKTEMIDTVLSDITQMSPTMNNEKLDSVKKQDEIIDKNTESGKDSSSSSELIKVGQGSTKNLMKKFELKSKCTSVEQNL